MSQSYYEESYPPSLFVVVVPSTSATAGIPGGWLPAGSQPPASVAALIAGTPNVVTAVPATAWTTGQYVQTRTVGAPGQANWNGTAWVAGVHALAASGRGSKGAGRSQEASEGPGGTPTAQEGPEGNQGASE